MAQQRFFRSLDTSFVECRTLGHAWDMMPGGWNGKGKTTLDGKRIGFRCLRCPTIKLELWSEYTGELLTRRYEHPEGYSLDHEVLEDARDVYGTMRQSMRIEYISRINSIRKQMQEGAGNIRPIRAG